MSESRSDDERIRLYEAVQRGELTVHLWGRTPERADSELFLPIGVTVLKDVSGGNVHYIGEVSSEEAAEFIVRLRSAGEPTDRP